MDWAIAVSIVSMVLAVVAIGSSILGERRSRENYENTLKALSEVKEKAAVIEGSVSETQQKLVDTVTAIAKPREDTQEELMMKTLLPSLIQNPQMFETLIRMSQEDKGKGRKR